MKAIYDQLKILDSTVIVTNMKKALMLVIRETYTIIVINHLLCMWHINKNVLINCKKTFDDKKA
jgi:hypothetical protein